MVELSKILWRIAYDFEQIAECMKAYGYKHGEVLARSCCSTAFKHSFVVVGDWDFEDELANTEMLLGVERQLQQFRRKTVVWVRLALHRDRDLNVVSVYDNLKERIDTAMRESQFLRRELLRSLVRSPVRRPRRKRRR